MGINLMITRRENALIFYQIQYAENWYVNIGA